MRSFKEKVSENVWQARHKLNSNIKQWGARSLHSGSLFSNAKSSTSKILTFDMERVLFRTALFAFVGDVLILSSFHPKFDSTVNSFMNSTGSIGVKQFLFYYGVAVVSLAAMKASYTLATFMDEHNQSEKKDEVGSEQWMRKIRRDVKMVKLSHEPGCDCKYENDEDDEGHNELIDIY